MRARTETEIKAYVDGYNACYKQFCECLKVRPIWKAIKKMDLFVTAVNGCIEDEPQIDGTIDDAKFKAHCLNCQRDASEIECLDCDGDKYFLPWE